MVLEIGSGSGQATKQFEKYNCAIDCVEPGEKLCHLAEKKFADNKKIKIINSYYQDADLMDDHYDLIISATAFHWVPQDIKYKRSFELLKPDGGIALFWNMHPELNDTLHDALENAYLQQAPEIHTTLYTPRYKKPYDQSLEGISEIEKSGYFSSPVVKHYKWSISYSSQEYISLLSTYANYQRLEREECKRLFDEIVAIVENDFAGKVVNNYLSVLYFSNRIN